MNDDDRHSRLVYIGVAAFPYCPICDGIVVLTYAMIRDLWRSASMALIITPAEIAGQP